MAAVWELAKKEDYLKQTLIEKLRRGVSRLGAKEAAVNRKKERFDEPV